MTQGMNRLKCSRQSHEFKEGNLHGDGAIRLLTNMRNRDFAPIEMLTLRARSTIRALRRQADARHARYLRRGVDLPAPNGRCAQAAQPLPVRGCDVVGVGDAGMRELKTTSGQNCRSPRLYRRVNSRPVNAEAPIDSRCGRFASNKPARHSCNYDFNPVAVRAFRAFRAVRAFRPARYAPASPAARLVPSFRRAQVAARARFS